MRNIILSFKQKASYNDCIRRRCVNTTVSCKAEWRFILRAFAYHWNHSLTEGNGFPHWECQWPITVFSPHSSGSVWDLAGNASSMKEIKWLLDNTGWWDWDNTIRNKSWCIHLCMIKNTFPIFWNVSFWGQNVLVVLKRTIFSSKMTDMSYMSPITISSK